MVHPNFSPSIGPVEEILLISNVAFTRFTAWIFLWPGPYNLLFVPHTIGEFFKRTGQELQFRLRLYLIEN